MRNFWLYWTIRLICFNSAERTQFCFGLQYAVRRNVAVARATNAIVNSRREPNVCFLILLASSPYTSDLYLPWPSTSGSTTKVQYKKEKEFFYRSAHDYTTNFTNSAYNNNIFVIEKMRSKPHLFYLKSNRYTCALF